MLVINERSVCLSCIHFKTEPEHISAHPEDDYPASYWCDEDMDNFNTKEGCYVYEREKD